MNGLLSRLQMICIALRSDTAAVGTPRPGPTHCPTMQKFPGLYLNRFTRRAIA